jgi:hypothetical protein
MPLTADAVKDAATATSEDSGVTNSAPETVSTPDAISTTDSVSNTDSIANLIVEPSAVGAADSSSPDALSTASAPAPQSGKTLDTDFSFIPKTLAAKCRKLIETYHAMNGYACLPDMLWQPELRDFIEMHKDFRQIFKRAATTRSAKRANDGFVLIATTILSLEVLASDFASWSARFPGAKRRALAILQEHTLNSRTWLMDRYLYPRSYINPAFINALSPPDSLRPGPRDIAPHSGGDNQTAVAE